MRLPIVSRLSYLLRTVPPSITLDAATISGSLVKWALVSVMMTELPRQGCLTLEQVAHDPSLCAN